MTVFKQNSEAETTPLPSYEIKHFRPNKSYSFFSFPLSRAYFSSSTRVPSRSFSINWFKIFWGHSKFSTVSEFLLVFFFSSFFLKEKKITISL